MPSKILCPTDGSAHATVGVQKAADLARQIGCPLTVCVVNIAHGGARGPTINHWTPEEASAVLEAAVAAARSSRAPEVSGIELVSREAAPAIVTFAAQEGFDHIVMGTGDKQGVKRLVLGSVAAEVAADAHCTVTIARA